MNMAPTLVALRTSLPPEGVHFALGRPGGENFAPALATACKAQPTREAVLAWGGAAPRTSTLVS